MQAKRGSSEDNILGCEIKGNHRFRPTKRQYDLDVFVTIASLVAPYEYF
ncbi:MAG: hypothetical protein ACTHKP_10365 [Nitrososphaeraceae archaeon]